MSTQPSSITPAISTLSEFEKIDSTEFAKRISMTESWVRNQTRNNCHDPIPHVKLGRYVRFEWNSSPNLMPGGARHRKGNSAPISGRPVEAEGRFLVRTVLRRSAGRARGVQIEREMEEARAGRSAALSNEISFRSLEGFMQAVNDRLLGVEPPNPSHLH